VVHRLVNTGDESVGDQKLVDVDGALTVGELVATSKLRTGSVILGLGLPGNRELLPVPVLLLGLDCPFDPCCGALNRCATVSKHTYCSVAVVAQEATDGTGVMVVIDAKHLVSFRVQTASANAAPSSLLMV